MLKQQFSHFAWTRLKRSAVVMALDALWIIASFFLALWIRFEFRVASSPDPYFSVFARTIFWWALLCVVVLALVGAYNCIWRYIGLRDLCRLIVGYAILAGLGLGLVVMFSLHMPRSYYCIGFLLSFCGSSAMRVSYRLLIQMSAELANRKPKTVDRVMIIGAGSAAQTSSKVCLR